MFCLNSLEHREIQKNTGLGRGWIYKVLIIRPLILSAWKLEGFFRGVGDMGYVGLKNHEKHYNKPPTALSCPPDFYPKNGSMPY
nr:MAG TPA: hypothetical protein [Caudoviricetes sp.]